MKTATHDSRDATQPAAPRRVGAIRLMAACGVGAALIAAVALLPVRDYLTSVLNWANALGPWGPALVAAVYIPACVLFLPGSVITLGAGFLFGLLAGTIAVSIGSTLGAGAAFLVGRTVARGWIAGKVAGNARFNAIDEAIGREGFKIVLLTRLSPVFPFNLLNYALGLTRVPFWRYLLASWIGMLPGTVMYVFIGTGLGSLAAAAGGEKLDAGPAGKVFLWAGLAVTVAVTVFITRVAKRALQRAVQGNEDAGDSRKEAES